MSRGTKHFLVALVILAVAASLWVGLKRHQSEVTNREVQLVVDYQEVALISKYTGAGLGEVFSRLKAAGVGGILVKEPTIQEFQDNLTWGTGGVLIRTGTEVLAGDYRLPSETLRQINPQHTYLITADKDLAREVVKHLRLKIAGSNIGLLDGGTLALVDVPLGPASLKEYGLGFGGFPWQAAGQAGLMIIPQVKPWAAANAASIQGILHELRPHKNQIAALLFDGTALPGFPGQIPALAQEVKSLGFTVGTIEFLHQDGLNSLVRLNDKNAVRIHGIRPEEIKTLSPAKCIDRLLLAANERNIRVMIVRFFLPGQPGVNPGNVETYNLNYLEQLHRNLVGQGLITGQAKPFKTFPITEYFFLLIGIGVWGGTVLLLNRAGLGRKPLGAAAAIGLLGFLALFRLDSLMARQAAALVAAIVFPVLGVIIVERSQQPGIVKALLYFLATTFVSLTGAALVTGLLGEVTFMLRLEQFLGTKAAHLAPSLLLLVFLWPLLRNKGGLVRMLSSPVTWSSLLVLAVAALGVYVLLIRTGNEGSAFAPAWERQFRHLLDVALEVRPRTKEFLVGHPLLLLGYYLGYRDRRLLLWIVGILGQSSIINTFSHIHTPLVISLLRTLNGIWLGLLIGLVLIGVYRLAESRYRRHQAENVSPRAS